MYNLLELNSLIIQENLLLKHAFMAWFHQNTTNFIFKANCSAHVKVFLWFIYSLNQTNIVLMLVNIVQWKSNPQLMPKHHYQLGSTSLFP